MVHIIMGSTSDMEVAEKAKKVLEKLKIPYRVSVASAHRTPELLKEVVERSDAPVFIAIAGLSAALPGSIAALTERPVIGVPVSGKLNLDSILSIVQMPPGIPVAAVGLDRGDNAALLAAEILALNDVGVKERLIAYRRERAEKVRSDNESVSTGGN
jgi:5-(carboxyamino)imidazole ribonucleotide mutase